MAGGCPKGSYPLAETRASRQYPAARLVVLAMLMLAVSGCVATTVGVVAGTVVAVGATAVKVPVKAGGAVIGAVIPDDEEEKDE
jgi:hypothetical protein